MWVEWFTLLVLWGYALYLCARTSIKKRLKGNCRFASFPWKKFFGHSALANFTPCSFLRRLKLLLLGPSLSCPRQVHYLVLRLCSRVFVFQSIYASLLHISASIEDRWGGHIHVFCATPSSVFDNSLLFFFQKDGQTTTLNGIFFCGRFHICIRSSSMPRRSSLAILFSFFLCYDCM